MCIPGLPRPTAGTGGADPPPDRSPRPRPHLHIERVGYGHPDARRLVAEVQAEYVRRYGSQDDSPLDEGTFEPPRGSFFVGYLPGRPDTSGGRPAGDGRPGRPVATGAWRAGDDIEVFGTARTAEVKRMYVTPRARGRGLARAMLSHLEATAAAAGAEAVILDTGWKQPEAIALYASAGYRPIPPYGYFAGLPGHRFFGKPLLGPVGGA